MKVNRVERQIIKFDKEIDNLCYLSKNLYNYCNYILRQLHFKKLENIDDNFKDLIKEYKGKYDIYFKISDYDLIKRLTKINQKDFRALPNHTSQQIIFSLYSNWKTYYKTLKEYGKDQSKFRSVPKPPKFKNVNKGRYIIFFDNYQAKLKNGLIYFPQRIKINPIKTNVDNISHIRIIPQSSCYVMEIVYKKEINENEITLNQEKFLAIDLGINNLATCVNNAGLDPFIINGKPIKSINQYYNKKKAFLQSNMKELTSKRIKKLSLKRNNKINDYFHKSSRYIINYCLENKIKHIIIGYNKTWKNDVNMGKTNNQNFIYIPFTKLINQLIYKGEEVGIEILICEERYTSKCSFLDLESIEYHDNYLGKRKKRGLFVSFNGTKINADINGAFNIFRKVVPEIFDNQGIEDLKFNPSRINFV